MNKFILNIKLIFYSINSFTITTGPFDSIDSDIGYLRNVT